MPHTSNKIVRRDYAATQGCYVCKKEFSGAIGLRLHQKVKHNIKINGATDRTKTKTILCNRCGKIKSVITKDEELRKTHPVQCTC